MITDPNNAEIVRQLQEISQHLQHLDKRDRNRVIWGWVKNGIHIVMFLVALLGSWYFIDHLGEIAKMIATESAKQSQQMMKSSSEDLLKEFQQMFK